MVLAHENKEEGFIALISFSHDSQILAVNSRSEQCKYFQEIMQSQAQVSGNFNYTTQCKYINGSFFNSTHSQRDLCTLSPFKGGPFR